MIYYTKPILKIKCYRFIVSIDFKLQNGRYVEISTLVEVFIELRRHK